MTPENKNINGAGLEHFSSIIKEELAGKQDSLTAGTNITIDENNVISATGGGGSSLNNILDGSATGSVRTSGSTVESSSYTIGQYAFAEGYNTRASGNYSHAEGYGTSAFGEKSHAEGNSTTAYGYNSHAEGIFTTVTGEFSHVEGYHNATSGEISHAEGYHTMASGDCQHVQGKYNIDDSNGVFAFIIGNGTSNNARSNALTVDWAGNLTCNNIPAQPSSDGEYNLNVSIVNGVPTYTWEENKTPNASTSTVGGLTVRLSGTSLYIRNDGGEA